MHSSQDSVVSAGLKSLLSTQLMRSLGHRCARVVFITKSSTDSREVPREVMALRATSCVMYHLASQVVHEGDGEPMTVGSILSLTSMVDTNVRGDYSL